jgi:antitoxin component YwqK of YwqJK toxin-antitoxin module
MPLNMFSTISKWVTRSTKENDQTSTVEETIEEKDSINYTWIHDTRYFPTGEIECEFFPHSAGGINGMKNVCYYENGKIRWIAYYKQDPSPDTIPGYNKHWNPNGSPYFETYTPDGKISQYAWDYLGSDYTGPGSIMYRDDGSVFYQTKIINGVFAGSDYDIITYPDFDPEPIIHTSSCETTGNRTRDPNVYKATYI